MTTIHNDFVTKSHARKGYTYNYIFYPCNRTFYSRI